MDFKKKKYKYTNVIHCLPTSVSWSTKDLNSLYQSQLNVSIDTVTGHQVQNHLHCLIINLLPHLTQ